MAKADKLEAALRNHIPPLTPVEDVIRLLDHYGFKERTSTHNHLIYTHPALAKRPDLYSYDPHLSIPTVKGRNVRKVYASTLLGAIDLVIEWNQEQDADSDNPA